MILPTKGISEERSLIVVGGELLRLLDHPMTISHVWGRLQKSRAQGFREPIRYDWFVLALDLLHCIGAIQIERGRLQKVAQ